MIHTVSEIKTKKRPLVPPCPMVIANYIVIHKEFSDLPKLRFLNYTINFYNRQLYFYLPESEGQSRRCRETGDLVLAL